MLHKRFFIINILVLFSTSFVYSQLDMHSRMVRQAQTQREAMDRFRTQGMKPFNFKRRTHLKYKFFIIDLNNDTIEAKEKIKVNIQLPIRKLTYESGKKIYTPDNTKEIFVKRKSRIIKGVKYGEYWIFKTYTAGDYSFYALYPELNRDLITLYQFKNSPIRTLDMEAVKEIVSKDEKASEILNIKGG